MHSLESLLTKLRTETKTVPSKPTQEQEEQRKPFVCWPWAGKVDLRDDIDAARVFCGIADDDGEADINPKKDDQQDDFPWADEEDFMEAVDKMQETMEILDVLIDGDVVKLPDNVRKSLVDHRLDIWEFLSNYIVFEEEKK